MNPFLKYSDQLFVRLRLDFILSALFIFLCLLHYFSLRPLWMDENFVLENIEGRAYIDLFTPLKHEQAFPRIYLAVIKFVAAPFNYHVLSLRLLPLIFMILSFFIWRKIYLKVFILSLPRFFSLLALTGSYALTYYAAELKPYSADVFVMGVGCLLLLIQDKWHELVSKRWFVFVVCIIPFFVLFSYITFFILGIVGYVLFLRILKEKKYVSLFWGYVISSLIAFLIAYWIDLQHSIARTVIISYWNDHFLKVSSFYDFIKPLGEGVRNIATWWYGHGKFFKRLASFLIPVYVFSLFFYGIKGLRNEKLELKSLDSLSLIVFFELIVFSIFKKYPFTGTRVTLFLAPLVFYTTIRAIQDMTQSRFKALRFLGCTFYSMYFLLLVTCLISSSIEYIKLYNGV